MQIAIAFFKGKMDERKLKLVDQIMLALQSVIDPELQIDVVNLGLIYGIDIDGSNAVVRMTLTIQGCPLSTVLQNSIEKAVTSVDGIENCQVKLVWYPVWSPERMSEEAKEQLGMQKETTEKTEKVIDFNTPIKQLADKYPDFEQIMYDTGFTRIKIPGLLKTVGRVMTIKLGAQAMNINLEKIKKAFELKGYRVEE